MENQIESDLHYFQNKTLSLSELDAFYEKKGGHLQLVKYVVQNNKLSMDKKYAHEKFRDRVERYFDAISLLCETAGLPDTILLISVNDGLNAKEEMPIFGMCKMDSDRIILLPDYEALGARYQVLKDKKINIAKVKFLWEKKLPQLIWRGSTAQRFSKITADNFHLFSRVKLCELSEMYPEEIDAKFTIFAQGGDKVSYLSQFQGDMMSFHEQMYYKYHILIDGNVSAYTKSGWKFFTNSLLFKPDSKWVQWYFSDLQPYVHYVPVNADLSDLIEKIHWALENDEKAKQIASRCRAFALSHFTPSELLLYLYHAIMRYHELNFVP